MTRPDRFTNFPKDAGRYVNAKGPHIDDAPDFHDGDLPESRPVAPLPPGEPSHDPFDFRTHARPDERPLPVRLTSDVRGQAGAA